MRTISVLAIVALLASAPTRPQEPSATVQVRAILVDKDLSQKPVPHLALRFSSLGESNAPPTEVKTGFDGTASAQMKQGKYRLVSPEGIEFQGRRYTWDLEVAVPGTSQTIELSNDNARVAEATASAPVRKTDELTVLFQRYQNSVVTVWSEIAHGTGFIGQLQGKGVHVLVLEKNNTQENLDSARKACREGIAQPAQSKEEAKPAGGPAQKKESENKPPV